LGITDLQPIPQREALGAKRCAMSDDAVAAISKKPAMNNELRQSRPTRE
jgi:hypothetical protein